MTVQVGDGISVPIGGDSSGLNAAVGEAAKKLQELTRKHMELQAAANHAAASLGKESDVTKNLKAQMETAKSALEKFSESKSKLKETADQVDQKLGKVQAAIGGIAAAAGTSGSTVQNYVGGMADLAMSAASGAGAIGILIAAFAALQKAMEKAEEAQKKLDELWDKAFDQIMANRKALQDATKEMKIQTEINDAVAKSPGNAAKIEAEIRARHAQVDAIKDVTEAQKKLKAIDDAVARSTAARLAAPESSMEVAQKVSMKLMFGGTGEGGRDFKTIRQQERDKYPERESLVGQIAALQANAKIVNESSEAHEGLIESTKRVTKAQEKAAEELERNKAELARVNGDGPAPMDDAVGEWYKTHSRGEMDLDVEYYKNSIKPLLDSSTGVASPSGGGPDGPLMGNGKTSKQLREFDKSTAKSADGLERFHDSMDDARVAAAGFSQYAGAIASGHGAEAIGGAIGNVVGTVIGGMFGGPAGGQIGGAIGEVLGRLLGSVLDEVLDIVGTIIRPLLEGVANIVRSLQPIMKVLALLFNTLGELIASIAPLLLPIFELVAMIILPFVRIIQLLCVAFMQFMPLIQMLLQPLDIFSWLLSGVDDALRYVLGSIIGVANAMIDVINGITEMGRKVFGDGFGVIVGHLKTDFSDISEDFYNSSEELWGKVEENTQATEDNTKAEVGQSLTNVPTGVKIADTSFQSARGVNVGVVNINARGTAAQEMESLRNRNYHGTSQSLGRNTIKDEKN